MSRKVALPVTEVEYYLLTPVEKYERYGTIPFKVILHILLLSSMTYQLHSWTSQAMLNSDHFELFRSQFMPAGGSQCGRSPNTMQPAELCTLSSFHENFALKRQDLHCVVNIFLVHRTNLQKMFGI